MQMLFQWDMSEQEPAKLEAKFWRAAKATESTRAFANRLFEGAVKDTAVIDRAILRLAIYELRTTDTPTKVILNEAVELAKKFSSEEAGAFVNGILDAVHKSIAAK